MEAPIHSTSPTDATYPSTTAWPPWTGTSSPPGGCLCPARAQWAAPSPQSAAGALWRGHTTVTGSTPLSTTKGKQMDICHLHSSVSTSTVTHHHHDHPSYKLASDLSYLLIAKTKAVLSPMCPQQTLPVLRLEILQLLPPLWVKSGMSLCTRPIQSDCQMASSVYSNYLSSSPNLAANSIFPKPCY